jgi:hypothetical protein
VPLQPFEAEQVVAFVVDQLTVLALPLVTEVGAALNRRVGAGTVPPANTIDFSCQPSPPPVLASQFETLLPAVAP